MEILEPRDLKGIQHKSGYGLKALGKNEIYIEKLNQPATNLIPILFAEGSLEDKAEKLKELGVDAKIIRNGEYQK